jgi:class I fructose-bisphosphate aldolase
MIMSTAKTIRLGRILQKSSQRSVIVPLDHGLTVGPIAGIESTHRISEWIGDPNIDAVIAHKGMIARLAERNLLHGRGVILHLNGMSMLAENPDDKEMVTEIETALRLGVDAVSVQVNFTGKNDGANLKLLGRVADQAAQHGFPLLVMLYDKTLKLDFKSGVTRTRHLLRAAVELGADAIKIAMPESPAELEHVFDGIHEDVLMFVAGGNAGDPDLLLARVDHAIANGASGVCIGRNVFGSKNAGDMLEKLSDVVHAGISAPVTRGQLLHAYR